LKSPSGPQGALRSLPSYQELRGDIASPPGSAWGLFGADDDLGTLNLIGPSEVLEAATLVRAGTAFPLNWNLELPDPPLFGRRQINHTVTDNHDGTLDDHYDSFYPQGSSQWDGLSHAIDPVHGAWNGTNSEDLPSGRGVRLGIDAAARRGIVGRFVLLDVAADRASRGQPIDPSVTTFVDASELDDVLERQGTELRSGDILLLRFGWTGWYERQGQAIRKALGDGQFPAPGLAPNDTTAAWLWDHHIAAVAADNPALEAMPIQLVPPGQFLHFQLIALLGMTVGELFRLDPLAAACRAAGVYEGLFAAAPLNKRAGVGSPANALAIL
jgi:kynurenine formamidase